jgi:hypothetical protein
MKWQFQECEDLEATDGDAALLHQPLSITDVLHGKQNLCLR